MKNLVFETLLFFVTLSINAQDIKTIIRTQENDYLIAMTSSLFLIRKFSIVSLKKDRSMEFCN